MTEDLGFLLPTCTIRRLRRGDLLFEEGDDCSELFVVVVGRIAIANKSIDGRGVGRRAHGAGDLFGEMALLDGLGRSAEARALEPSEVARDPLRTAP